MRMDPRYTTYYISWTRAILLALFPFVLLLILNGKIIRQLKKSENISSSARVIIIITLFENHSKSLNLQHCNKSFFSFRRQVNKKRKPSLLAFWYSSCFSSCFATLAKSPWLCTTCTTWTKFEFAKRIDWSLWLHSGWFLRPVSIICSWSWIPQPIFSCFW